MECPVCNFPTSALFNYGPGRYRCGECQKRQTVSVARVPCQDGRRMNGKRKGRRYLITRAELARRGILVL